MRVRMVSWTGVMLGLLAAGCGGSAAASAPKGTIAAIGAENEYADVIAQIGGRYVHVTSILNNPNTDPHSYETSPRVARQVAGARLVVQNGLGYDDFMNKIESASSGSARKVLTVQHLLGLPDSTPNPHLWYAPTTMPAVAKAIGDDLAALQPAHAGYFRANVQRFDASLKPWTDAIAGFKARYGGTPVATTEPVADYLLQAMGTDNLTPFGFQADIMNGTDPTPQDITLENNLFTQHKVKVFGYNHQVVSQLTAGFRATATHHGVPVVGLYETMPTPGYDYQKWMLAETNAITAAVAHGTSSERL